MIGRALGLPPTIVLLAVIHFIVDGYGNILLPLLPLLIPRLGPSLAAAGTLQMCLFPSDARRDPGCRRAANWKRL
jgi:hypothetical protein